MQTKILSYPGNKLKYSQPINNLITQSLSKNYIELFLGSGSIFFNLPSYNYDRIILNDSDEKLINILKTIKQSSFLEFKKTEEFFEKQFTGFLENKEVWYSFKDFYNKNLLNSYTKEESIALRLLINSCFSNQVSYNKRGEFSQGFGGPFRAKKIDENNFEKTSNLLRKATLLCEDFRNFNTTDFFVFADPPYASTFQNYRGPIFNLSDLKDLHNMLIKADSFVYTDMLQPNFNFEYVILRKNLNKITHTAREPLKIPEVAYYCL